MRFSVLHSSFPVHCDHSCSSQSEVVLETSLSTGHLTFVSLSSQLEGERGGGGVCVRVRVGVCIRE